MGFIDEAEWPTEQEVSVAYKKFDWTKKLVGTPVRLGVAVATHVLMGIYLMSTWTHLPIDQRPVCASVLLLGIAINPILYLLALSSLLKLVNYQRKLASNQSRDTNAKK